MLYQINNNNNQTNGKMKKEKPILYSAPMVLAILEDRKTQTRREIKDWMLQGNEDPEIEEFLKVTAKNCPHGTAGDILWVKETFTIDGHDFVFGDVANDLRGHGVTGYYNADKKRFGVLLTKEEGEKFNKWQRKMGTHSSLFMFKSLSRIRTQIQDVKIERIQEISESDCKAEGANEYIRLDKLEKLTGLGTWKIPSPFSAYQFSFLEIWCSIKGCQSWLDNPYVWAINFKRL